MNGFIFYEGLSQLDGKPIVGIATGLTTKRGANRKTGAMVQTYILRADVSPVVASRTGEDRSICGDCKHRKVGGMGTCYVRVENGPLIVWKGYTIGRYPRISHGEARAILSDRIVRLGAYGDPAAIPFGVWANILGEVQDWTGYTHAWNYPGNGSISALLHGVL